MKVDYVGVAEGVLDETLVTLSVEFPQLIAITDIVNKMRVERRNRSFENNAHVIVALSLTFAFTFCIYCGYLILQSL